MFEDVYLASSFYVDSVKCLDFFREGGFGSDVI